MRSMDMGDGQDDVAQLREWVGRLQEFIAGLDSIEGDDPFDFCDSAMDVWKDGVSPGTAPPQTSPAMLIIGELIGRFNDRRGLYALQTGPGFTPRVWVPPFMLLAPRVLAYTVA